MTNKKREAEFKLEFGTHLDLWEFCKLCVDRFNLEFISNDPAVDARSLQKCIADAIYFTVKEGKGVGLSGTGIKASSYDQTTPSHTNGS